MPKFNEIFKEVYVINLKHRPDKLKRVSEKLSEAGIEFKVFNAITPDDIQVNLTKTEKRIYAPQLSHRAIWKDCLDRGVDTVFIFEDDVTFIDNFDDMFSEHYRNIPDDWNIMWLGLGLKTYMYRNNIVKFEPVNEYWQKFNYAGGMMAYGVTKEALPLLLTHTEKNIGIEHADFYLSFIEEFFMKSDVHCYNAIKEIVIPEFITTSDAGLSTGIWMQYYNRSIQKKNE